MKLLGIRFCSVDDNASDMIDFFANGLGLNNTMEPHPDFVGGVFPNYKGDSWIEVWQASEQMPKGIMLQLVVDNADEYAEHARSNGLKISDPMDAHGERIYYVSAPNGMNLSFQSKLSD